MGSFQDIVCIIGHIFETDKQKEFEFFVESYN